MLQTLFYIPFEVAGWPVFGFGLLLAAWAAVSVVVLAWLVLRQGFTVETRGYLPVMLIVAAVIAWVLPVLCEPRGLPIRGYGMMILLAVLAGMSLAVRRARRAGIDPEMIFSLALWMIVPGILGARAVYVAEYWFEQYWPVYLEKGLGALLGSVVNVTNGGLVVYGSFFGGVAGMILFCRLYRVPLLLTSDIIAPSLVLGLGLGRIGCLLNGCCFGGPCDLPWKITFPWNSPVHVHQVFEGEASVYGLKLSDGPHGRPVIAEVESGSDAEHKGLKPQQEIHEINGVPVTSAKDAYWAILNLDRLHVFVKRDDGKLVPWTVDDPPLGLSPASDNWPGYLRIYGVEIAGDEYAPPVIAKVRPQSAAMAAGLEVGQRIERLSGRRLRTIRDLYAMLRSHRKRPWLRIEIVGIRTPYELIIARPLPRSQAVHPTQVYSSIDAILLCLLLLAYHRFCTRDGQLTALMLTIYPITRFLVEGLRTDEPNILGTGMHISQNISLALLAFAVGLWFFVMRQPKKPLQAL